MITEEGRYYDPMTKWVCPEEQQKIKNTEALLAILQNPFMATPIQEMGLDAETLTEIYKFHDKDDSAYILTIKEGVRNLALAARVSIDTCFKTNGINTWDNLLLEDIDYQTTPAIDCLRVKESPTLESSINAAKLRLDQLKAERDARLKSLHVVSITVPSSVTLVNNKETIIDTARDSLAENFTSQFNAYATAQIKADISDLQNETNQPSLLKRFTSWLSKINEGVQLLESFSKAVTTDPVHTTTLEFAVRTTEKGGHKFSEMRELIFKWVAAELSGLGLTEDIANRLLPNYIPPHVSDTLKPYDWIEILSPQEPN
jgi:hypothetical protein